MYLSKIEIFGFKSFAQNVNLSFDSGITAIVGPNGCGKTNIVDAIRWALGEQRYSTLRSDKMEDVIFNGTKNRKPLSMAEVSLIIENTKGILPTEYSQVTVSRRVYRSGESEYLLNRVPCRLRDILDLFMDTGMGADAYSVIELKMVETILSDKTDERRRLFEEAAGVTKYKHRRKAAYNKLQNVQQDLVRVNDIVKEVQKTVNALERQSKRAEQYNELSKNLKSLEIDLLEHEYAYLHGKLIPLQEKYDNVNLEKITVDEELSAQETHLDKMRAEISEVEKKLIEFQKELADVVSRKHKLDETIIIGNEKKNSNISTIERFEKEIVESDAQKERLGIKKIEIQEKIKKFDEEIGAITADYNQKNGDLLNFVNILIGKKTELAKLNDEIISILQNVVQKNGEKGGIEGKIENLFRIIDRDKEDLEHYENEINKNSIKVTELTVRDKELRRQFLHSEMELFNTEELVKKYKSEIAQLQQDELSLKNEIHKITAKIDFLTGLIERQDGQQEGVKYLITEPTLKSKKFVTVGDIVNTDEKFRPAIEAALGEAINYIVVEKKEHALEAINILEKEKKGRAVFVCLDRVPEIIKSAATKKSSVTWAADVVKVKQIYRPLINFLLADVVLIDKIDKQASLAGVKEISFDGNIKSTSGIYRGGSFRSGEGGLIGKAEQVAELESEKTKIHEKIELIRTGLQNKSNELSELDIKKLTDEVKSFEKQMASVEMQIAQIEFEKKRANDFSERLKNEIEICSTDIDELKKSLQVLIPEIEQLELKKSEYEKDSEMLSTEINIFDKQHKELSKVVNESEIRLVTLQGEMKNAEAELERDTKAIKYIVSTIERRNSEILELKQKLIQIASDFEEANSNLSIIHIELKEIEAGKKTIDIEYNEKREAIHKVELKIKDDRRIHDDKTEILHEVKMKISEISQNIAHLKERARNEFDLEIEIKVYPEDEWVDFAAKREEVRQMKERIRMLGAINFAAFDEYNTESERLNFLTQQRDDLLEAERTLLDTIEEINNTAQKKFLDTFTLIRENFIKTFKSLFDQGDECDLRLEEGEDPLEAGIEIIAKPRGKRPTSIDLLSGGEKTLTAIALLFAIYLVKPSPFCILDEVDAPLDDSNIDRYTRIIKTFSDNTQFIVVTHNKRTMESANALYGVTMEEEGVSKIVTVRFNEESRVAAASIASGA